MEVILLEKIHKLGALGDQVRIKPGYGRNYLIPSGKAVPATKQNIEKFEARRAELERTQADVLARAQARAVQMAELNIVIQCKAGSEGKLYGSVGTADIAAAVSAQGIELSKHEVRLADGPFRVIGEHKVGISLHADVETTITINITPEDEA